MRCAIVFPVAQKIVDLGKVQEKTKSLRDQGHFLNLNSLESLEHFSQERQPKHIYNQSLQSIEK